MIDTRLKICLWSMLAVGIVTGCASSDKTDGLEEEVNNNASIETGNDLDLENLDIPGETKSQESFNMPRPDREVLNPEIDPSILLAPSDASLARAAKEMAKADAERAEALAAGDEGFGNFNDADGAVASQVSRRSGGGGGYRVPKIPGAALQKKGALLNRFYFVRNGDTPDSVAALLYGDAGRGQDLKKWNSGGWKPGKLIYYASPTQPEEHEMRSFYQERNVPPEEYLIQKGDSLFKVAQAKYGNQGSWKEVAVINGFAKVEKIEPGTRIALYPADLKPYAATASANGYRRNAVPPSTPEPSVGGGAGDLAQSPQESVPPVTSKAKKSGGGLNLNFGSIIEQNLFAIVLGGGIFVLLILLMALSKQRKKKSLGGLDEFNEPAVPSKKSKRK